MTARTWARHRALHPGAGAPAFASIDEAYAAGHRDGAQSAEARLAADLAAARDLIQRLEAALGVDLPSLAPAVEACVLDLVAAVVGESRAEGDGLRERVKAALFALGEAQAAVLLLHPDDIALIGPCDVRVRADAQLARGDLRLVSGDAELSDLIGDRLAALA